MTTKKTAEKTADRTPAKAPGKAQDAPNPAIQENPQGTVDRSAEAHFLGTDALPGEPGEHGALPAEADADPMKERKGDTDQYWLNDWNGYKSYQCRSCQFNTLDPDSFRDHWESRHALRRPPPPDAVLPKFDRFGNYVPPESK